MKENLNTINKWMETSAKEVPNFLYRYNSIKRIIQILTDKKIFLPSPSKLNDVYEFSPKYIVGYKQEEINKICHYFLNTGNPLVTDDKSIIIHPNAKATVEQLERFTKEFDENSSEAMKSWFIPVAHNFIEGNRINSRILCFSESNKIDLMWAHYASSHKGVCVQFDVRALPVQQQSFFRKVKYSDDPIEINLFEMATNQMKFYKASIDSFVHKKMTWSYEQEWRLVLAGINDYFKDINFVDFSKTRGFIKSIILGLKTSEEDKNNILELIKDTNIGLFQCQQVLVNDRHIQFKQISTSSSNKFGETIKEGLAELEKS